MRALLSGWIELRRPRNGKPVSQMDCCAPSDEIAGALSHEGLMAFLIFRRMLLLSLRENQTELQLSEMRRDAAYLAAVEDLRLV